MDVNELVSKIPAPNFRYSDVRLREEWLRHFPSRAAILDSDRFVWLGGDSVMAVQMAARLEQTFAVSLPAAVDILLRDAFSDFRDYLVQQLSSGDDLSMRNSSVVRPATERGASVSLTINSTTSNSVEVMHALERIGSKSVTELNGIKRKLTIPTFTKKQKTEDGRNKTTIVSVGRGSKVGVHQDESVTSSSTSSVDRPDKMATGAAGGDVMDASANRVITTVSSCPRLELSWRYDTGKCVDASPLVAVDG